MRWVPQGSTAPPRNSRSTVTGPVVPLMVSSPSTFPAVSPSPGRMPLLWKRMQAAATARPSVVMA